MTTSTRLQLALDTPASLALLPTVARFIDIAEIGTPLLKRFGLSVIATVAELAPELEILVDSKTVDGGGNEAEMLFRAGAKIITVLSCASHATIFAVGQAALEHGAQVVIDTLTEPDPAAALTQVWPPGMTYLSLHTSTDARLAGDRRAGDNFDAARRLSCPLGVVLAGGIDHTTIGEAARLNPAIVVVGRAITGALDPPTAAQTLREALR